MFRGFVSGLLDLYPSGCAWSKRVYRVLLTPIVPTYTLLLVLGVFLGVGGASFAIALPMAGSSYPPHVQGLVLGLAASVAAVFAGTDGNLKHVRVVPDQVDRRSATLTAERHGSWGKLDLWSRVATGELP